MPQFSSYLHRFPLLKQCFNAFDASNTSAKKSFLESKRKRVQYILSKLSLKLLAHAADMRCKVAYRLLYNKFSVRNSNLLSEKSHEENPVGFMDGKERMANGDEK